MESFAFNPLSSTSYYSNPYAQYGAGQPQSQLTYDQIFGSLNTQNQMLAQQQALTTPQASGGMDLAQLFSTGKDLYSLLPDSMTAGVSDIFSFGGAGGSLLGATSPLMTGINSWAVGAMPSVFGNLGGGIGALASGSAGGSTASLAAAEAAAGMSGGGATLTGMLGPAAALGALGYFGGGMLWPDKPNAAIGSGIGTGLGALGGSLLGSSLGGAAAGGAASAAATGAMAGSWAGPIGMGIGALAGFLGGGALGGAFGGKKGDPSVYTNLDTPFTNEGSFTDVFKTRAWGQSGASGQESPGIFKTLGRAADRERDKILREIKYMEDKDMAAKLTDALSKQNVRIGRNIPTGERVDSTWNFEISHGDVGSEIRKAKSDTIAAVRRAYDKAKQSVGYTG